MKKKLSLLLALVLITAVFTACGGTTPPASSSAAPPPESSAASSEAPAESSEEPSAAESEAPVEYTKLIVGLDDTFAPMGFRNEASELVGFDIDLATAVGEEMGIEIQFQPIDWDSKEMELEARTIDCIWNGMSRTPEREASMTLSQNYLNNKIIIMTNEGVELTDKAQLKDYKIGTQAKSSALEVVQSDDIYAEIEANVSEYSTYDECILDMQAGRIDVMIVDEVLGQYKNANLDKKFGVSSVNFGEDYYVIGFRKSDTDLCKRIEEAIKALQANGKAAEISTKWFGEDIMLEMK